MTADLHAAEQARQKAIEARQSAQRALADAEAAERAAVDTLADLRGQAIGRPPDMTRTLEWLRQHPDDSSANGVVHKPIAGG